MIGKTSTKPTRNLADNVHWNEIACLIRLVLVASHHSRNVIQAQLYIPETVHIVTLVAATGQTYVRKSVYGVVVNLLSALYSARLVDSTASPEIQMLMTECEQPETLRLFGLTRPTPTSDYFPFDSPSDKLYLDTLESLTRFLARVLDTIAGSKGVCRIMVSCIHILSNSFARSAQRLACSMDEFDHVVCFPTFASGPDPGICIPRDTRDIGCR